MDQDQPDILSLRMEIAELRGNLRHGEGQLKEAKAVAETKIIAEAGGIKAMGANQDERDRALLVALCKDLDYRRVRSYVQENQAKLERLEAVLEAYKDDRRHEETVTRAKLAEALDRLGTTLAQSEARSLDIVLDQFLQRLSEWLINQQGPRYQTSREEAFSGAAPEGPPIVNCPDCNDDGCYRCGQGGEDPGLDYEQDAEEPGEYIPADGQGAIFMPTARDLAGPSLRPDMFDDELPF